MTVGDVTAPPWNVGRLDAFPWHLSLSLSGTRNDGGVILGQSLLYAKLLGPFSPAMGEGSSEIVLS